MKGDWAHAWQPMVDAVGRDFGEGRTEVWGETIEASMVRRYIEPLELDSKLHSDAAFARAHGYADIVVPSTAIASFAMPLLWNPGDSPLFDDAARDAQPTRSHIGGVRFGLEPPTTHFFGVDAEADYLLPVVVGDRLCRRGALLLSCKPKETRVGQGAFISWQTEVINGIVTVTIEAGKVDRCRHPSPFTTAIVFQTPSSVARCAGISDFS